MESAVRQYRIFAAKEQNAADMEIITFDHKVYQDLSEKIKRIADYVFKKETLPQQTPEIWLTSEELADLLKISTRTLQRMRKERVIPYTMLRSKCLYRLSDVEECIARRIVTCAPQTLRSFARPTISPINRLPYDTRHRNIRAVDGEDHGTLRPP